MRIVDLSIRRPVTVVVFAAAAVVFGLVAFDHLAVDLLPDITYPSLTIKTTYEGTAPAEVETLLTRPIEDAVGVVNNVVRVSSSSRADVSEVTLELAWGTDMDFAALDVRERLDLVRLPAAAETPILLRYDPQLDPIMKIALHGSDDLTRMRFLADEGLSRELERIEGVAAVLVSGGLEEEVEVELDERRLANLGLTAATVRDRLAAENVNLTGGTLREGETEYLVRTLNELQRPEAIARVVVARSGNATIRLEDVGRVVTGHKEREIITRVDGEESVELAVYKEGGTNTVTVSDAVRGRLDAIRAALATSDPGLELDVVTDQARYIRQSVGQVLSNALYGGLLAIVVLFFFLRSVKKTAIIALSIPVSVVATFFLMYAAGISLNVMSLGGLTLGIGLLVDNGIVVLEAVQRRSEDGLDEATAAREGASEVAMAITASTLTTICVFVPIVFVEGVAAQLFRDQAITVAFSLVVSLVVAITLVPMLASRRLRLHPPAAEPPSGALLKRLAGGPLERGVVRGLRLLTRLVGGAASLAGRLLAPALALFDVALAGFRTGYERLLGVVLRRPATTFVVTLLVFVASLGLYRQLGRELIPELVQGELYVDLELPPGTRLEVSEGQLARLERYASSLTGVARAYSVAGASGEQGGVAGEVRENIGQLRLGLEPPIDRGREEAVVAALRRRLDQSNLALARNAPAPDRPALAYRFGRPSYFSFRSAVEVEIRGDNLPLLEHLAAEATRRLRLVEGLADVKASTEGGSPELQVHFDRDRLAAFGLDVAEVAERIRTKVEGEIATDITRTDRTVDIRVRNLERYRDSAADLANLNIAASGTTPIPVASVADVVTAEGPAEIRRADGSRVALISGNLAGRDLGSVTADIDRTLGEMRWPAGYEWRIGGQEQEMRTSFGSMRLAFALAVFMVYLVMASQFESLLHPFVILFSVPFALIGAFAAMRLFGVTLSVVSLIGIVLLAGIAVNDAIVKIDYTNQLRRAGMAKLEALRRAGLVRLRPILMTSATTVLGLLPMAIGLGEGAELRVPMAVTVIGGLFTSTLLTLLVVPAVYTLLDRSE